jgi:hypothetical protein
MSWENRYSIVLCEYSGMFAVVTLDPIRDGSYERLHNRKCKLWYPLWSNAILGKNPTYIVKWGLIWNRLDCFSTKANQLKSILFTLTNIIDNQYNTLIKGIFCISSINIMKNITTWGWRSLKDTCESLKYFVFISCWMSVFAHTDLPLVM